MPLQSYKLQVKLRKSGSEEGIRVGKVDQWEILLIAHVWGQEFKTQEPTQKSSLSPVMWGPRQDGHWACWPLARFQIY